MQCKSFIHHSWDMDTMMILHSIFQTIAPQLPKRRAKVKSGLLPLGCLHFKYSHVASVLEGGRIRSFFASSPLTTGVLVPDGMVLFADVQGWA
ncbi:hypothetical protein R6Q59_033699 [Mikania micrantha]